VVLVALLTRRAVEPSCRQATVESDKVDLVLSILSLYGMLLARRRIRGDELEPSLDAVLADIEGCGKESVFPKWLTVDAHGSHT
jgi:hypothetical protein